jgi:surfeit locus 1 family protein
MTDSTERSSVPDSQETASHSRSFVKLLALAIGAAVAFAGFVALGTWQLYRLQWKLDLITRVEQRVHAPAVAAPGPTHWAHFNTEANEYRHVRVTGTFLCRLTTRVHASTALGAGYWVITPMRDSEGTVVLINRGFIPMQAAGQTLPIDCPAARGVGAEKFPASSGITTVTGLLRISEPRGAFLHSNDLAGDRWYSRDVQAIATARGLTHVAPYFIDSDAGQDPAQANQSNVVHPVGGLTVVTFPNNHLSYALTWYALALMVAGAFFLLLREGRRWRGQSRTGTLIEAEHKDDWKA